MSLWVDKYRPRTLDSIDYHEDVSKRLKALASSGDFPHLLVYGPSGAGKKTRVIAVLHELFGAGVEKMKIDVRTFQTSSNRKLEFNVVSSPYHMEITPSDLGNNDRVVIQDLLKEIAQTEQVDFSGKHRFKVVIINEADSLSRDAQAALRRTMEKYSKNIRLILISNTTSNIIAPIKSRTLLLRIPSPTIDDITKVLSKLASKQEIQLPSDEQDKIQVLNNVGASSKRNLRRALLLLEALTMQNETLKTTTPMITLDWEGVIKKLAGNISRDRNVARISSSRTVLYELISHCIPPKIILKTLAFELLNFVNDKVKSDIVELAAIFDERLSLGTKSIFHLEGFIAKSMVAIEKNA
ncbi:hypothetical protein WICANDRAFT_84970 [Wickerhamomyces anomalus NRRL Y-366-8]|uniref:Replication factor C subunit 5 n=1 Tax=Wickerhamomyces anomalus (strain ATCC 58044 / CBS 1984 / NCYC 433 / NRRL Y-366-8) TaxID=683960 RepID=A0A1E3P1X1_WICAA|nr:uncharacterized protein WICANDRAFT_84970 [Wickerhamomyces anomalus NRRL Y-366-8]ODQ59405.1 hypothetical protein WICANDRAFT_84970 [Wickerhamomyces anomalus NRRL Y-366-8]